MYIVVSHAIAPVFDAYFYIASLSSGYFTSHLYLSFRRYDYDYDYHYHYDYDYDYDYDAICACIGDAMLSVHTYHHPISSLSIPSSNPPIHSFIIHPFHPAMHSFIHSFIHSLPTGNHQWYPLSGGPLSHTDIRNSRTHRRDTNARGAWW